MPRRLLQRYMPHPETLKRNRSLRFMGHLIGDASLWMLTRRSVGNAFMVGLFCALLPIPFQMVVAVCGARLFLCNLPLSVGLVWLTNPLTMPLIFYGNYRLGAWLLDTPPRYMPDHMSPQWIANQRTDILPALLVGSLAAAVVIGVSGNVIIRLIWRWQVARSWKRRARHRRRRARRAEPSREGHASAPSPKLPPDDVR